jgi:hypothetical protein
MKPPLGVEVVNNRGVLPACWAAGRLLRMTRKASLWLLLALVVLEWQRRLRLVRRLLDFLGVRLPPGSRLLTWARGGLSALEGDSKGDSVGTNLVGDQDLNT